MKNKLLAFLLIFFSCGSYAQTIRQVASGVNTSIRGLSVVDNSTIWVSGSNGWSSLSTDGGNTWKWKQLPGYEKYDFRDIEAFSKTEALMLSAGSPAVILYTSDGGEHWVEVYRNESPDIFLDGMDFINSKKGIIYGDPIQGRMQLLRTIDGGQHWEDISENLKVSLHEGEAGFAASGTGIRTLKNGQVFIITGGSKSRLFSSANFGDAWKVYDCPIIQGKSSAGPFSIAFLNNKVGVAAGGDYLVDTSATNNFVVTRNGGRSWEQPLTRPYGYRSSVEYVSGSVLIATGTSGTDISSDGGLSWKKLSTEGYHVVRKAKSGTMVLLSGNKGRIAILEMR